MRSLSSLAAAFVLSQATAGIAQTEVPIGSRIPQPLETAPLEQDDSAQVRDRFAACMYDKRADRVDALLAASDSLNVDYQAAGITPGRISGALAMESCLSKATSVTDTDLVMKTNLPALRAMMLEYSYRAHNPLPPAWLSNMPSSPARYFASKDDELARVRAAASFADCVVAAAPREADALIRTPATSAAEKAALKPLIPYLGPCIPAGMEVKLDPGQLRAFVADGLWAAWHAASAKPLSSAGVN